VEVEEGRLVERPCPRCGNIERRAFGEVEGERGELASYALGWTSGHEDVVGHLTIGIGAGNPGGGSFHIEVRMGDDRPGMSLVDEPFEDVPEGGPNLTRQEALAHVDVQFVWFVADQVMLQDHRAWWMEHWLRGRQAFAPAAVIEGGEPVLSVARDEDGEWHLGSGSAPRADDTRLVHLFHALDRDPSLLSALDLEPGQRADRKAPGKRWKRLGSPAALE
jgi:hypothetical protein